MALRSLTLAGCVAKGEDLAEIVRACPALRTFALPRSYVHVRTDPQALASLSKLRKLRKFDFTAAASLPCRRQTAQWVTDEALGVLAHLPHLERVVVSGQCSVTDQRLRFFVKHSWQMRVLHVDGCAAMSEKNVFTLLKRCANLESVRLPKLLKDEDRGDRPFCWHQGFNCPKLQEFGVDGWEHFDDAGAQALAEKCCKLRTLSLRGVPRLTDSAVEHVVRLPMLAKLVVTRTHRVTDLALLALGAAGRLEGLDLSSCHSLTREALTRFADSLANRGGGGGPPALHTLRLEDCNVSAATAHVLSTACCLRSCSLRHCQQVPLQAQAWSGDDERRLTRAILEGKPLQGQSAEVQGQSAEVQALRLRCPLKVPLFGASRSGR